MPVYEVELDRGEDARERFEVRPGDRPLRVGSIVDLAGRYWVVLGDVRVPRPGAVRYRCRLIPNPVGEDPPGEGDSAPLNPTEVMQRVNAIIRQFAADGPPEQEWEFFCECGCFDRVTTTLAAYDSGDGVWAEGHRPTTRSA